MANRTFATKIESSGKLDAGIYKCDVVVESELNQESLIQDLMDRLDTYAKQNNGMCDAQVKTFPAPSRIRYTCTFSFLNLESMLYFAQTLPYPQDTRSIEVFIDFPSLIALI